MNAVDIKVVIIGKGEVGKTCLMNRYISGAFNEHIPYQNTIGGAYRSKMVEIDDGRIVLGIWDTAGTERYNAMVRIFYRGAKAAIVCYEVTDNETFDRAKLWIRELRNVEENCKIYLCATKKDLLDNQIPSPDLDIAQKYANSIKSKFFMTSSKTGENVDEVFQEIIKDYVEANPDRLDESNYVMVPYPELVNRKKRKSRCC